MSRMKKKKDKKVFTRTAAKSKKINIAPKIFRGGIRVMKPSQPHESVFS